MTRSSALKGLSFPLSQSPRQANQRCTVSIKESICESPSRYEVAVLILLMSVPAVWVVLAGYPVYRDSHPADNELTRRSSSHEAQPLLCHRSYGRRGPGIYFVSGDYRTVVVAFAPY